MNVVRCLLADSTTWLIASTDFRSFSALAMRFCTESIRLRSATTLKIDRAAEVPPPPLGVMPNAPDPARDILRPETSILLRESARRKRCMLLPTPPMLWPGIMPIVPIVDARRPSSDLSDLELWPAAVRSTPGMIESTRPPDALRALPPMSPIMPLCIEPLPPPDSERTRFIPSCESLIGDRVASSSSSSPAAPGSLNKFSIFFTRNFSRSLDSSSLAMHVDTRRCSSSFSRVSSSITIDCFFCSAPSLMLVSRSTNAFLFSS
mmetsp:Transcript_60630/g.166475  ORF Transcript_60630/g.166475 Transcript_60630/m.166475 type:complete len:263 (+) Transcript_60630:513-1301(+)